jgi:hypothetical protein
MQSFLNLPSRSYNKNKKNAIRQLYTFLKKI